MKTDVQEQRYLRAEGFLLSSMQKVIDSNVGRKNRSYVNAPTILVQIKILSLL